MQKLESYKITSYLCSIKSNKIIHKQKTTHNDQRGNYGACSCIIIGSERRYITVLYNELYWRKQRKVRDCRTSPKVHSQTICHVRRCVIGRNERRKRIVNKFLIYKQKITAMHNNEFVIDEWYEVDDHKEEFGTTSFKEFDGTEREDETRFKAIKKKLMAFTTNYPTAEAARVIDAIARKAVTAHKEVPDLEGGIIGGLQDQDWDTADRDIYDTFLQENKNRVKRYIERAIKKAKEDGGDPYSAAYQAADFYDEVGLTDAEINVMIEAALNPPPKVWTIGFRLNGKPEIHVKETTAKDGISAWQSIKDFYESGGDRISWAYTY